MRGLLAAILAVLGALTMVSGFVPAAHARTLQAHYGKVIHISDGDTFGVRLSGRSTESRVRLSGLQATELAHRSGETNQCGAREAKARLSKLIYGKTVRLTSYSRYAKAPDGRLLRYAAFKDANGNWRDAGAILADEGLALWEANRTEWDRNRDYNMRTSRARLNRRGPLWHTAWCGIGPQENVPLKVWAQWDADGADNRNINGEYVKIKNLSQTARLSLSGWALRDRSHYTWRFPRCASIAPGATVIIRMGTGTNNCAAGRIYAGRTKVLFGNPDANGYGNGIYLLDPKTDIRGAFTYPCGYRCTDPLKGKIEVTAQPSGNEYADLKNASDDAADLGGYLIENQPYTYEVRSPTVLQPGQVMRLYVGPGTDTWTGAGPVRYWNLRGANFRNDGETVRLRTFDDITLDCYHWGDARC